MENMTLDEIIAKNKANSKGRGKGGSFKSDSIGRKRFSAGNNTGRSRQFKRRSEGDTGFSKRAPTGRWQRDLFSADDEDFGTAAIPANITINKKVRVNLSNLAETVVTADLEELFVNYDIDSAAVHYGEDGQHLGTGVVVLKKRDAVMMVDDFKGVSVDGQRLAMFILDGGDSSVRVSRGDARSTTIRRVSAGGIQKKRLHGGRRSAGNARVLSSRNGGGGLRGSRKGARQPPKTEAELDAELDAYMAK